MCEISCDSQSPYSNYQFCILSQGEPLLPAPPLGLSQSLCLELYKYLVLAMGSWAFCYVALCLLGAGEPNTQTVNSDPVGADPHSSTLFSRQCQALFWTFVSLPHRTHGC